ncbi:actin maturation protease isoform X1 [Euwallacea fornicatus]|uniref:actin maturation protease isoform X1 n=1 Tax=Euwallacea fornicatus TaxID=995702 RepID=UPI00338EAB04
MDFTWALPYPDLHKICTLFSRTDLVNPLKWQYTPLLGYLQNGPQCGLVALAILMDQPSKELVDTIFKYAQNMGFSHNGEIFSTNFMYSLAKEFIRDKDIKIYNGNLESQEIVDVLLNKGKLLIPYDTNKDNSPGLHGGHKAHWCVVSGVIQTQDDVFVIARHGKAKNVAIWNLKDLAQSNLQLFEFSPDRKLQDLKYKLPEGGIAGALGLNRQSVLICDTH